MSLLELYIVFSLGLVSSLHCIQMCGPIVVSYSLPLSTKSPGRQLGAHLSYNAGRILTYSILGSLAGVMGKSLGFIGNLAGIENITATVAGVLMILTGLVMLDLLPQLGLKNIDPLLFLSRLLKPIGKNISSNTTTSKFILGLTLGFLPCGLIYAALLKSMATGTPLAGGLTMMAFGLGTSGSLMLIGMFSSSIKLKLGRWGGRLAAISVTLLGVFLVWRGVMAMMVSTAAATSGAHCH